VLYAAGRHIPLIVENVCGAQKWVGRARWNFGSFYLWGDVPALMPIAFQGVKVPMPPGGDSLKVGFGQSAKLQMREDVKVSGLNWAAYGTPGYKSKGFNVTAAQNYRDGIKNANGGPGGWFGSYAEQKARGTISPGRMFGSKSDSRKAASAMIAKIPLTLSRHIARTFRPLANPKELGG